MIRSHNWEWCACNDALCFPGIMSRPKGSGPCLNIKTVFPGMGIPMLKIRLSHDHLIFNMVIPILVRWHHYIEMDPSEAELCSICCCELPNKIVCGLACEIVSPIWHLLRNGVLYHSQSILVAQPREITKSCIWKKLLTQLTKFDIFQSQF